MYLGTRTFLFHVSVAIIPQTFILQLFFFFFYFSMQNRLCGVWAAWIEVLLLSSHLYNCFHKAVVFFPFHWKVEELPACHKQAARLVYFSALSPGISQSRTVTAAVLMHTLQCANGPWEHFLRKLGKILSVSILQDKENKMVENHTSG